MGSTVKREDLDDATQSASPSAAGNSEPTAPSQLPSDGPQLRDRERYQIIGEHGRGGLGRVSRAHDRELGRDVAIKELIARGSLGEVRFLREALITARLEHPGIVPVHEAGRWPDGTPFYAMKLVAGRPLRQLIAERTTVAERVSLLHHVIAVADAIAYAHGRNIIHRDLKPSNVIVGEFGETIVIDWGLAKDLTVPEESTTGGRRDRSDRDLELTAAGDVLGTPAYMSPEQERGEPVDQRADVFAIGAMLWELCALRRVPPAERGARHQALRRAGIDPDLITIIDKALDVDPARRYPDAGALAADLKAFKSGARIAARRYSPLALLAHWIRRHRAVSLSVAAVAALALAGAVWSFENIAAQRDRADTALARTEAAQRDLSREHAELTLKHAELLVASDPAAALDALATYHGSDQLRADQLAAEARGRGAAILRVAPHAKTIIRIGVTLDGSLLTMSRDGTVKRTALDGSSVTLARNGASSGHPAYDAARGLLAYECEIVAVCLLDVVHGIAMPIAPVLRGLERPQMALSPSGNTLAVSSRGGLIQLLDVSTPARPVERLRTTIDGTGAIEFVTEDVIAVGTEAGFTQVRLAGATQRYAAPDGNQWNGDARTHELVIASRRDRAVIVDGLALRQVASADICHGEITNVKLIPGRHMVAYGCKDGSLGTWGFENQALTLRAHLAGRPSALEVSADGDYVLASGNEDVVVLDLQTQLVTTYKGHHFLVSEIAPPLPGGRVFSSADSRGNVRSWPLPSRLARGTDALEKLFLGAVYDQHTKAIVATSFRPSTTVFTPPGDHHVAPRDGSDVRIFRNFGLARSDHGERFATYGTDAVELWATSTASRTRILTTGHGIVTDVLLLDATGDVITVGRDGRVLRWSSSDEPRVLARLDQAITHVARLAVTQVIVVSTADGGLWRIDETGRVDGVRSGGSPVARLLAIPESATLVAGYDSGEAIAIETRSWRTTSLVRAGDAIRDIVATPDGRTLAIAASDDSIHVGTRGDEHWTALGTTWSVINARARQLVLTPDGLLVAACNDGLIWLYVTAQRRWLCLATAVADLLALVASSDGSIAAAFDRDGRVIWIDVLAAKQAMTTATTH